MHGVSKAITDFAELLQSIVMMLTSVCAVLAGFMTYAKWSASKKDDAIAKKFAVVAGIVAEAVDWVEEQDYVHVKMNNGQKIQVNKAKLALEHVKAEYERAFGETLPESEVEVMREKIDAVVGAYRRTKRA